MEKNWIICVDMVKVKIWEDCTYNKLLRRHSIYSKTYFTAFQSKWCFVCRCIVGCAADDKAWGHGTESVRNNAWYNDPMHTWGTWKVKLTWHEWHLHCFLSVCQNIYILVNAYWPYSLNSNIHTSHCGFLSMCFQLKSLPAWKFTYLHSFCRLTIKDFI